MIKLDYKDQVCFFLMIKYQVSYGQATWHINMKNMLLLDHMEKHVAAWVTAENIAHARKLVLRRDWYGEII